MVHKKGGSRDQFPILFCVSNIYGLASFLEGVIGILCLFWNCNHLMAGFTYIRPFV